MGIKTTIVDTTTDIEAEFDSSRSLKVTSTNVPPKEMNVSLRPFVAFLTDDGTTTGDEDLRVDGSTTSVEFFITSGSDGDRYIQTLAFTIADAGATLNNFGNITALTNGCELLYEDAELGSVVIASLLKSNFDFVQLCNFEPTFGSGADAFRAKNVVSTSEAYIPLLDVTDIFGLPYGIRLPANSTKKITIRINDNVTGVDRFDVKAFGFDRIEND